MTLEYSPNVAVDSDLAGLFRKLHDVLAETGGIELGNCKSRAYVARDFFVGAGGEKDGFVHLEIRFLEGRSPEIKRETGQAVQDTLTDWFQSSMHSLDLQVTVEVRDIERSFYFKYPEGTLTGL